jgi:hypothetical protein
MELSEAFWMAVLASGVGLCSLAIKRMSNSKCDEISICGLKIHRRVELELNIPDEENPRTAN